MREILVGVCEGCVGVCMGYVGILWGLLKKSCGHKSGVEGGGGRGRFIS